MKKVKLFPALLCLFFLIFILGSSLCFSQKQIAAGGRHSLALCSDSTAKSFGRNSWGQLGNNSLVDELSPINVLNLTGLVSVAAGTSHSLFLKADGTVWTCGQNVYGELGNGNFTDKKIPVKVLNLTNVISIWGIVEGYHSLAIRNDSTAWTWGWNADGELGDGTLVNKNTPVQVKGAGCTGFLTGLVEMGGGSQHTVALKSDGTVWCWGSNTYGQLGNGNNTNSSCPVQVTGLSNIISVSGGQYHCVALKNDGTVWTWGVNWYGQLGNGTTTNSNIPIQVSGLTNVIAIAGGGHHCAVIKSDGTVWSWGDNPGNGNSGYVTTPVQTSVITKALQLSAGDHYTLGIAVPTGSVCALTMYGWGGNGFGGLGTGSVTAETAPAKTTGMDTCFFQNSLNISVSPDATIQKDSSIIISASATGSVNYLWSPASGLSCLTCSSPLANPTITTTYYVTVTNYLGCSQTDSIKITVTEPLITTTINCEEIFVPNAFSPNEDNSNDNFCIEGINCVKVMSLFIYNRWGEKVFSSSNPNECWNAMYKNKALDTGVFCYILNWETMKGESFSKKGTITLVR